jgi:hypothetical protein
VEDNLFGWFFQQKSDSEETEPLEKLFIHDSQGVTRRADSNSRESPYPGHHTRGTWVNWENSWGGAYKAQIFLREACLGLRLRSGLVCPHIRLGSDKGLELILEFSWGWLATKPVGEVFPNA